MLNRVWCHGYLPCHECGVIVIFLVTDDAHTQLSILDIILAALPDDRQNLLFSATLLTEPQGTIAQQLDPNPFRYSVGRCPD